MTGIPDLTALIERLEAATAEARQATSDAHSATKEMRLAHRELAEAVETAKQAAAIIAKETVDELVAKQVEETLVEFGKQCREAIGKTTERIDDQLHRFLNVCLFGNEQGRGTNVFDALRDYAFAAGAATSNARAIDKSLPDLRGRR